MHTITSIIMIVSIYYAIIVFSEIDMRIYRHEESNIDK